jgi:MFS family permease
LVFGIVCVAGFVFHALRARDPLIDLRLFRKRSFMIANLCTFLFGAILFGSMFLLPLYYQVARQQSALVAGLLMAPQGIGAALVMRRAGAVSDRYGARRVVPLGVILMVLGTLPFAFVTSTSNELVLGLALVLRGVGLGLAMMPIIAAAYQDLDSPSVPRATSMINIIRQGGGSIAVALFAVVLQREIEGHVTGAKGGLVLSAATTKIPAPILIQISHAFANTFWWTVGAVALVVIPTLFLPHHRAGQVAATVPDAPSEAIPALE